MINSAHTVFSRLSESISADNKVGADVLTEISIFLQDLKEDANSLNKFEKSYPLAYSAFHFYFDVHSCMLKVLKKEIHEQTSESLETLIGLRTELDRLKKLTSY